jgi:predicted GNAT family N-acyltransferase
MNDALNTLNLQVRPAAKMQLILADVNIFETTWRKSELALRAIRTPVFVIEQLVTPEFEWDDIDATAVHVLATLNDAPIACLRIIDYHKIGRMAVLKQHRGNGLGAALLLAAEAICKQHGSKNVQLSAQTQAIGFYEKCGFKVTSAVYQDLHIPHVDMQKTLA